MNESNWAVDVQDLMIRFGEFYAVNNISFQVRKGEIFGFLGANGAGKTTTIRVLCGLLIPTSGKVWVAGKSFNDGENAIKEKVGYMSQRFTLYNDLTVAENLAFIASLRKINPAAFADRKRELLDFISFDRDQNTIVQDLPGGTKQQVSLVAALLHDPEIVFLDEPTAGVTPAARIRFWALIQLLARKGKTIFVTTHYMDEAEQCQRIALMRAGKLIGLDTPSGLKATTFPNPLYEFDPIHPISYSELQHLNQSGIFSYFETYGLRFHASIESETLWNREKAFLERKFRIRKIQPTLEDVFIRSVEGTNR